jgi:WhiB family transcriptional regulator, redox-sensing transcriptional regulator
VGPTDRAAPGREDISMTIMTGRVANWRASGACLHADPDLFFPISSAGRALGQIAQAKAICARCPVIRECLEFAYANTPIQGIWGGTTPEERQQARRRD